MALQWVSGWSAPRSVRRSVARRPTRAWPPGRPPPTYEIAPGARLSQLNYSILYRYMPHACRMPRMPHAACRMPHHAACRMPHAGRMPRYPAHPSSRAAHAGHDVYQYICFYHVYHAGPGRVPPGARHPVRATCAVCPLRSSGRVLSSAVPTLRLRLRPAAPVTSSPPYRASTSCPAFTPPRSLQPRPPRRGTRAKPCRQLP